MNIFARILSLVPAEWLRRAAALQWRFPAMRKLHDLAARSLRNVDGVIARGAGRGLRFNAASANAGYLLGTSEPAVQNALALLVRQGWTVFDLGANVGFLSMISGRLVGPSGRIVAFEPLPSNAEAIERNAALNGFRHVEVHTVAVGESAGESNFFVSEDAARGKLPLRDSSVGSQLGEIRVRIESIDDLRRSGAVPRPDLIKLDIEGAEILALRGARETLERDRPLLMIELHGTNREVAELLEKSRYRAVVIGRDEPVATAPWNAYVVAVPEENREFDALLERFRRREFGTR